MQNVGRSYLAMLKKPAKLEHMSGRAFVDFGLLCKLENPGYVSGRAFVDFGLLCKLENPGYV